MSGASGKGLGPMLGSESVSSFVNTDENCVFRISAFDLGSACDLPSFRRGATPLESHRFDLT